MFFVQNLHKYETTITPAVAFLFYSYNNNTGSRLLFTRTIITPRVLHSSSRASKDKVCRDVFPYTLLSFPEVIFPDKSTDAFWDLAPNAFFVIYELFEMK